MKAVLISIQPKWCALIANGEKTIEVRKTKPKLETPFKCYIYATKNGDRTVIIKDKVFDVSKSLTGKVIGEFVCDRIDEIIPDYNPMTKKFMYGNVYNLESTCLENEQCQEYGKGKPLYGWHISDLKIYDKPKELSEFGQKCNQANEIHCRDCINIKDWNECCETMIKPLTRPPQSWCYVEDLEQ